VTQVASHPPDQLAADSTKPTLVVLGSGWGATSFLKNLDTEEYNVVVVSPRNYFLFTPLLPSVTVGTLEPRSIIQPTRFISRHKKRKVAVYEAEAQDVDPVKKTVTFQGEQANVVHLPFRIKPVTVPAQNCMMW
jgi:NADH:ubiquinone reductase (non-electrogenic)